MAIPIPLEMFEDRPLNYDEIQKIVKREGFGLVPLEHRGNACAMSFGIDYAMLCKSISISEVLDAMDRFLKNDFGTMYDEDEEPVPGSEYGCYPSAYGSEPRDGAIMVHRDPRQPGIVVYFQFER